MYINKQINKQISKSGKVSDLHFQQHFHVFFFFSDEHIPFQNRSISHIRSNFLLEENKRQKKKKRNHNHSYNLKIFSYMAEIWKIMKKQMFIWFENNWKIVFQMILLLYFYTHLLIIIFTPNHLKGLVLSFCGLFSHTELHVLIYCVSSHQHHSASHRCFKHFLCKNILSFSLLMAQSITIHILFFKTHKFWVWGFNI